MNGVLERHRGRHQGFCTPSIGSQFRDGPQLAVSSYFGFTGYFCAISVCNIVNTFLYSAQYRIYSLQVQQLCPLNNCLKSSSLCCSHM
uniref:Uncharacterized protein n=1 Tax=Anguilla anguilla TaxID=7936 RepID=A0A0E9XWU6_ANGAN